MPDQNLRYWTVHETACWFAGEVPATDDKEAHDQVLGANATSKAGVLYRYLKDDVRDGSLRAIPAGWYGYWRLLPRDAIGWANARGLSIAQRLVQMFASDSDGQNDEAESATILPNDSHTNLDIEEAISGLFDPVGTAALEKMFPTSPANPINSHWKKWAGKAAANGLKSARRGRGKFNPYRAALWWLNKHDPDGWDLARCQRTLANNLPVRSRDSRELLIGETG